MIDVKFWRKAAEMWSKADDGIAVPDDQDRESRKAREIEEEDLVMFDDISNDEISAILSELGLDDF